MKKARWVSPQILATLTVLTVLTFTSSGCALGFAKSLHEYDVLDRPVDVSALHPTKIKAEKTQSVVVATDNTRFVDEAYEDFLSRCPAGRIVNVSVKSSSDLGFLAYENHIEIEGDCLKSL